MGLALSQNLIPLKLNAAELASVQNGLADGVLGRPSKVDFLAYKLKFSEFASSRFGAAAEFEKKAGAVLLAREAAEPGAVKQPTGFVYKETKAGTGAAPKATEKVKVHYRGTLPDGTVFDSSIDRGQPMTFSLSGVIPCWTQGLQLMKEGGKARLVCPPDLAYGDMGSPPKIKGGATLVFEVELISIEK
jgi:FKBP-type peptidyl-prolyl cis-trans isomerase FkpA/FKBP-type peptidyl-prolyl cis-trans isomerase FklB